MRFHLGDILSVTTERLVSPDRLDGVQRLVSHMTGQDLMTHQLPRAVRECAPALLAQHPDLAAVQAPSRFASEDHVWAWLAEQTAVYGETREVEPLAPGDHTAIHPVAELRMIRPDIEIVEVQL